MSKDFEIKVTQIKQDKPRICEVLGVEVGEPFKVDGYGSMNFHIEENGEACSDNTNDPDYLTAIYQAINHPDRIIRKPRFTQQEVEIAKAIRVLFPEAKYIERVRDSKVLGISGAIEAWIADIDSSLFPEIKSGQAVTLDEIIGGAK